MIVLDSAAVVEYLTAREYGGWVGEQVARVDDVHSPHLLDVEVAHAMRNLVLRGELGSAEARRAFDDLAELEIQRYAHTLFLRRIWQLRAHVTAYDAVYVALAEALDAPLVTTDLRLARSHGHRARIVAPE